MERLLLYKKAHSLFSKDYTTLMGICTDIFKEGEKNEDA